jgi:hypothetical protein
MARDSQTLELAPRNQPMLSLRNLLNLKVGPVHGREQKSTTV